VILQNYARRHLPALTRRLSTSRTAAASHGYAAAVKAISSGHYNDGSATGQSEIIRTRAELRYAVPLCQADNKRPPPRRLAINTPGSTLLQKRKAPCWLAVIGGMRYSFTRENPATGWVKDGESRLFYLGNKAHVGWWISAENLIKKRYYFDANAVMVFVKRVEIAGNVLLLSRWLPARTPSSTASQWTKMG
jgi:hypothetical protein